MPEFRTRHRVSHSAENMFDLVADVECYPQFLPLCESLAIRSQRQKGGREMLLADMTIGYKAIRQTFTSQVMLNRPELAIDVQYLDGPFRRMDNRWHFLTVTPETSDIDFFIDYEFKSRALGMLMGSMFDTAFRRFSKAFEERADQIYGQNQV